MRYLGQFTIIIAISFLGEALNTLIPLPIPASIYGLLLMLLALCTRLLKPEQVKDTADFLIAIMPVMFIPAATGLMKSWSVLEGSLAAYAVITVVTTVAVMAVAGRVTQWVLRRGRKETRS